MSEDYEIGYSKPPKSGQFKKGSSGNPKGRPPRKAQSIQDLISEIHQEEITAIVEGKPVVMPKSEALLRHLRDQAVRGDIKSAIQLIKLQNRIKITQGTTRLVEVDYTEKYAWPGSEDDLDERL